MGRFALSGTEDWQLQNQDQDIRGWSVRDTTGNEIGMVAELIANTESERVESIVLDTGDEYPARDIELREGTVYLQRASEEAGTEAGPVIKTYESTRVLRSERGDGGPVTSQEEANRAHYNEVYAGTDYDYPYYEPAYRYGYMSAMSPAYQGRDYQEVESELRRNYEQEQGEGTFERVKEAIRHAYHRGQS